MPPNRALMVMYGMRNKLDIPLLKAFEPVGQQVILGLSDCPAAPAGRSGARAPRTGSLQPPVS